MERSFIILMENDVFIQRMWLFDNEENLTLEYYNEKVE